MKRIAIVPVSAVLLTLFCGSAMAFQTGQIYKSKDGEWMCIDKWGNEIPPSSSGGWTVVNPPRTIGGDCSNRRAVLIDQTLQSAPADLAPLLAPSSASEGSTAIKAGQ